MKPKAVRNSVQILENCVPSVTAPEYPEVSSYARQLRIECIHSVNKLARYLDLRLIESAHLGWDAVLPVTPLCLSVVGFILCPVLFVWSDVGLFRHTSASAMMVVRFSWASCDWFHSAGFVLASFLGRTQSVDTARGCLRDRPLPALHHKFILSRKSSVNVHANSSWETSRRRQ